MSYICADTDHLITDQNPCQNKIPNPLARFKTYSYYHVLAVCDTTDTGEALAHSHDVDTWLHRYDITTDLTIYSPKTVKGNDSMRYCILINGSTDAANVITKVSYSTLASAGAVNNDRFTSLAVEGSIEISEPKGVSFLDTLTRCCVALGKDSANVVYMLKTFFIGYNDDDVVETISDTPPLMFNLTDATGSFTEQGGSYTLGIIGMANGLSRLPQYDHMTNHVPIKGTTLFTAVIQMQNEVNTRYKTMYDCIEKQVAIAEPRLGYAPGEIGKALRQVEYKIELADLYKNSYYTFDANFQQNSSSGVCGDKGNVHTGTDRSLESALQQLMTHCERVNKDSKDGIREAITCGSRKVPVGTKVDHKIHTLVQTHATNGDKSKPSHTITYRIEPYPVPRDIITKDPQIIKEVIQPNTLMFDYIYTGKNVDILEFDMKLTLGLAYLQTATLTNTFKDQGEPLPSVMTMPDFGNIRTAKGRNKLDNQDAEVEIPVFFSSNLNLPSGRTKNFPVSAASSAYQMSKHSSVEVLDVTMKITGNLLLLSSAVTSSITNSKEQQASLKQAERMDWGYVPGFAKVNIRMPAHNDDIRLFGGDDNLPSFTKPFWFQGYYYILGVEHVFDDGEFVQNLQMIGLPEPDDIGSLSNAEGDQQLTDAFSQNVAACYSDCNDCTKVNAAVKADDRAAVVAQSQASEYSKKQAIARMPPTEVDKVISTTSPDNIKGWTNMDPKSKAAIESVAAGDRIPLSTYAAFVAIESSGNTNAKSVTGCTGLFQFSGATWKDYMPDHPITKGNDPRTDPTLNAQATRKYMNAIAKKTGTTDPTVLYMGHNLGLYGGSAAYRDTQAGKCTPMKEIYSTNGFGSWEKVAKVNGYGADDTSCDVRAAVAGKMNRVLKDGSKVAKPAAVAATPAAPETPAPAAPVAPPQQTPTAPQATVEQKQTPRSVACAAKCAPTGTDGQPQPGTPTPAATPDAATCGDKGSPVKAPDTNTPQKPTAPPTK